LLSWLQDNVGSTLSQQQQPSPQSSPEVNVTSNTQPDIIDDHMTSGTQLIGSGGQILLEEEVDLPDSEEAEVRRE